MWVPRSRGAVSGILLIVLGLWGALIPFVGPYFSFSFVPDQAWTWTSGRGWLEVLPGVVTAIGGILLLFSANRAVASFGAWLAVVGGAWFIVGPTLAPVLHLGEAGPVGDRTCDEGSAAVGILRRPRCGDLVPRIGGDRTVVAAQSS